jgi:hypothetical protein
MFLARYKGKNSGVQELQELFSEASAGKWLALWRESCFRRWIPNWGRKREYRKQNSGVRRKAPESEIGNSINEAGMGRSSPAF